MHTILLVERDAGDRAAFVGAIDGGHRVIAVGDLGEAWEALDRADLLVVGLEQSDEADLTILDRVQAARPDLPVVLTAPATLHGWRLLRAGMRLGARDFLTKPFDPDEVRQTVLLAARPKRPEPSLSG
jgi:DNA-binding NtrC family response regulator